MKAVSVYQRYYLAEAVFNGVRRRAAQVMLTAESDDGMISYEISVNFFPHADDEDFAVSYDAFFSRRVYQAKGRRSKKREAELMKSFRETVDSLCGDAKVLWDSPLTEARLG